MLVQKTVQNFVEAVNTVTAVQLNRFFSSPSFPAEILNTNEEMCCGKTSRPSGLPCASPKKPEKMIFFFIFSILKKYFQYFQEEHDLLLKFEAHKDLFFLKNVTVKVHVYKLPYNMPHMCTCVCMDTCST